MEWCEMNPDPRVKNSGTESAPRRLPRFNPIIITPPTPTNPPQAKSNGISKIKESEPTPKQDENVHPNTCNIPREKTG